jgi:1,4-alpha-glucan branching enzyme
MIEKSASPNGLVEVTFTVEVAPEQTPVTVVGDFNGWDPDATALKPTGDGRHSATVRLQGGQRYAFRYRDANGRWFNDETADDYTSNDLGGMNAVVVLE